MKFEEKTTALPAATAAADPAVRVGITEAGDPAHQPGWAASAIHDHRVAGVVVVTKDPLACWDDLVRLREGNVPAILHVTATGWGGTRMEPGAPHPEAAVTAAAALAKASLVRSIILRIDPIIPTPEGCNRAVWVARMGWRVGLKVVRFSLLHLHAYRRKEVLEALSEAERAHLLKAYGKKVRPSPEYAEAVARRLDPLAAAGVKFSTCATNEVRRPWAIATGCIDTEDLAILGIDPPQMGRNKQRRKGCLCLALKTEILDSKKRCAHECAYCYWRD